MPENVPILVSRTSEYAGQTIRIAKIMQYNRENYTFSKYLLDLRNFFRFSTHVYY